MRTFHPPLPPGRPTTFRATVHGTVFCERASQLSRLDVGDEILLIPGPPTDDDPGVWVHTRDGDVVGHLPPEIEYWLSPWLLRGGRATGRIVKLHGDDIPSYRRLLLEITCG